MVVLILSQIIVMIYQIAKFFATILVIVEVLGR